MIVRVFPLYTRICTLKTAAGGGHAVYFDRQARFLIGSVTGHIRQIYGGDVSSGQHPQQRAFRAA